MSLSSLPLLHLTRLPTRPQPEPPPVLVLVHGVRSNEDDLFSLVPYLDGRFLVASVRGPVTFGPGMYGWLHAEFRPDRIVVDEQEAEASRLTLVRFIDELVEAHQADPARVYLMGFSQGAVMALNVGLTRPDRVAGVVAMSGRVMPEIVPKMAEVSALEGLAILMVHGTEDPVLPVHLGRDARDRLGSLPVDLTYREYPMAHEVTMESLNQVAEWLTARLDGPPS